jgi:hypothetical protein
MTPERRIELLDRVLEGGGRDEVDAPAGPGQGAGEAPAQPALP